MNQNITISKKKNCDQFIYCNNSSKVIPLTKDGELKNPINEIEPINPTRKNDLILPMTTGNCEIGETIRFIINQGAIISEYFPANVHSSPNTKENKFSPKKYSMLNGIIEIKNKFLMV